MRHCLNIVVAAGDDCTDDGVGVEGCRHCDIGDDMGDHESEAHMQQLPTVDHDPYRNADGDDRGEGPSEDCHCTAGQCDDELDDDHGGYERQGIGQ